MGLAVSVIQKIKHDFENHCIMILVSAYYTSILKHDYRIDWMENDFTSMLDKYIQCNPQRVRWRISCNIEEHLHSDIIQNIKGFANKESRIDMRMSSFCKKMEYFFYVEAKRLKENDSDLLKRYIDTGINHYITQKYPHGILLGYLVKGGIDTTIQKINDILNNSNRSSEILVRMPNPIHNQYFESTHANFGVIKHFVFDYSK
ncbi:MAG: hypothetical protein IKM98_09100 [Bacteroidales bacterium]|nr:hypothetical protein [Bacteroidales bacterium]